jgi:hypothetical protein
VLINGRSRLGVTCFGRRWFPDRPYLPRSLYQWGDIPIAAASAQGARGFAPFWRPPVDYDWLAAPEAPIVFEVSDILVDPVEARELLPVPDRCQFAGFQRGE